MGPAMMAVTIASTAAGLMSSVSQNKAAKAQSQQMKVEAAAEQRLAERRALQTSADAQSAELDERRQTALAQSNLLTTAGASGSGVGDQTVTDIWGKIGEEGEFNADVARARGDRQASDIRHQGSLGSWSKNYQADAIRSAGRQQAISTGIGAIGNAVKGYGMAQRYSGSSSGRTRRYG